jgi:hypothetical protein
MANNAALNGLDFYTQYSVGVTSIKGHLDMPNPKKRISKSWDDENGEDVYVGKSYFEAREITMELFIQAATKALFVSKIKVFFDAIRANGLQALTLGNIPKTFLVYYKDSDEMVRLSIWNDTLMIGKFKVRFVEPNPLTRQFTSTTNLLISFTLTTTKVLTIVWGDGTTDTITGTAVTKSKTFATAVARTTVIYGDIDSISGFSKVGATTEINGY